MKPKSFKGQNVIFGENQKEYQPLPAQRLPDGEVVTRWEFTDDEIERVIKTRCMYIKMLTFNKPLPPIMPVVELGDDYELNYPI